ncbi:MAG TPA: citrate:proton symporter [Patescibacteria group bacterium]|nr:citrate:proton symporter [Patescibacteria group bacterium]
MPLLSICGFAMVAIFMYLIMSKRLSAMVALIAVPIIFGISLGFQPTLGKMMMDGVKQVAPTGIMICFAILYFGIMIDAGMFDPLIKAILRFVKGDPVRIAIGTAALAALVSLDGDGSTTYLVTTTAMLGVHRAVGMNPMILPAVTILLNSVMNIIPWGGPTGRVLASLKVESGDVFVPMIPAMVLGVIWVLFLAYRWGKQERVRLGIIDLDHAQMAIENHDAEVEALKRPEKFWINIALTVVLLVLLVVEIYPLAILFMIGTALALLINYPSLKLQGERVAANGANAMPVVALIFAAGIFMGIMAGTKMSDVMAKSIIAMIPPSMGPHFPIISAVLSLPGTFFMTNDAYYFGVLPVLTKAAAAYGIPAAEMGRAALIGQGSHLLSPLVASTYLLVGMNKVEFGDLQKYALLPAMGVSFIWLIYCLAMGLIRF